MLVLSLLSACTPVPAIPFGDASSTDGVDGSAPPLDAGLSANIVFVTSTKQAGGSLGGLAGADALCNARATAAGLPGTYVAWLSTAAVDARDRLGTARGWVRVDGKPVVDAQGDLINGRLWYPPMLDETGAIVRDASDGAVTNTLYDGRAAGMDCTGWTSTTPSTTYGAPSGSTRTWTEGSYTNPTTTCGTPMRLYCFGIDRNAAVTHTPDTGPLAFVDPARWLPSSGIDADQQCQATAGVYGLSGTFRAFRATSTASAASRFDLTRPAWVRLDGVRIAATRTAFMAGELDVAPSVFVDGHYDSNLPLLWTGAPGTATSLPTETSPTTRTCRDWMPVTGDSGGVGWSQFASRKVYDGTTGSYSCMTTGTASPRLLCLED